MPQNRNQNAAHELAQIVRAAWRRLFICERHQIGRHTPETCELCILESISGRRGRPVEFHSIPQIMNTWPGGGL